MKTNALKITCLLLLSSQLYAQVHTQTIRGTVVDQESKTALPGAYIEVLNVDPQIGTASDIDGSWRLDAVPIGRHTLVVSYLGYEILVLSEIPVTSGKELVLDLELVESFVKIDEVVVSAEARTDQALNEMSSLSARSISVNETKRYAGSFLDPARMAQNFAGVSHGGDDLSNEIVVRGNSPQYVQYRLEGIEIPNPTHFAATGSSGGAISMLSSSTLGQSDFYSGAFPSEYGNALAGIFDLRLRTGNNEKRESSLMVGLLGLEASTEGPFHKDGKSSYLINYRYSTLAALDAIGLDPAGVGELAPTYSDISFKLNFPTKLGTFSVFGLGGNNKSAFSAVADSSQWLGDEDAYSYEENGKTGIIGVGHQLLLNDKSYIKSVFSASTNQYVYSDVFLDATDDYAELVDEEEDFRDDALRANVFYHNKLSAKNTLRVGFSANLLDFNFEIRNRNEEINKLETLIREDGSTHLLQSYAQWKSKLSDRLTLNSGLHFSYFGLSQDLSLEPRVTLDYRLDEKSTLGISMGRHSRMEHLITYLVERKDEVGEVFRPNRDLGLTKANHVVLGYNRSITDLLNLKVEAYYQRMNNVPRDDREEFGDRVVVNATNIYPIVYNTERLVNEGQARNFGIDLSLSRSFHKDYYWMITGSVFESQFQDHTGEWFDTRWNTKFNLTVLGGKEFAVGPNKKNTIGLNAKGLMMGGNRITPVDRQESQAKSELVLTDQWNAQSVGMYKRIDLGASYTVNREKLTHRFSLELQNAFNLTNVGGQWYNVNKDTFNEWHMTGLFPNFNYRIEF